MQEIDGDIQKIREEVMDFLRDKIAVCIKYYNDELKDLNDSFKMPQPEKAESRTASKHITDKMDFNFLFIFIVITSNKFLK